MVFQLRRRINSFSEIVTQSFSEMGCDPQKIITSYARIKSLRKTVRVLCKECRILESRTARSKEILPLCEQIDSFEIGFPELVVFRSAAFRIAEMEKQLNDTMMKIQVVNLVSESLARAGRVQKRTL